MFICTKQKTTSLCLFANMVYLFDNKLIDKKIIYILFKFYLILDFMRYAQVPGEPSIEFTQK